MPETTLRKINMETDFRSLFESAPGSYLVLSPDLKIVAVSDSYNKATMTKREEIVGRNLFDVFPDNPDDSTADGVSNLRSSLESVLKNKISHVMPVQKYDIRRPDGTFEERYWNPINKPLLNSNNEVVYIMHYVEDVTNFVLLQKEKEAKDKAAKDLRSKTVDLEIETYKRSLEIRKLNQELEEKVIQRTAQLLEVNKTISDYKFALDASSIVAITDQKGIIKEVNENFCKISKYKREELIGQDHRIINSGYHSKEFIRDIWVTIANGEIWKGELRNKAKDGTIYWVDTTIIPFLNEDGKPYQYVAIRSDITRRKKAEAEILQLKDELEDKVKERTLELTHSLERERELNNMKSRFVSMASHEFRTPLSSILSSTSLLEKYTAPEHEDKRDKHFERIKQSVRNLTGILEDFLSLDKLEQGKTDINLESFDLKELAENIKGETEGLLKSGQLIHSYHDGETEVVLDKKILRNILLNLLSNAIKYSLENKGIELSTEIKGDKISIKVKDAGIGIPEDEQKNLFKTFFRATNAETIQGTGLGLTIVKRYVELLDGQLSFTSVLNEGTTFIIVFPKK